MARVSRDATSYRASGVIARDARHTHDGPEVAKPKAGRKDKNRWCRGKVGREHMIVVALSNREWYPRLIRYCSSCGREFDAWSGNWVCGVHNRGVKCFCNPPSWALPVHVEQLRSAQ